MARENIPPVPRIDSIAHAIRHAIHHHRFLYQEKVQVGTGEVIVNTCCCGAIFRHTLDFANHQISEVETLLETSGVDIEAPIVGR